MDIEYDRNNEQKNDWIDVSRYCHELSAKAGLSLLQAAAHAVVLGRAVSSSLIDALNIVLRS